MASNGDSFAHVRHVDFAHLRSLGPDERYVQRLLDHESGARTCEISCIRTPAGGGSPAGMHVHAVDQIFYVLSGIMRVEVGGERMSVHPGGLVVFPASTPHRNWNEGPDPTIHLAFNTPLPDPGQPFAVSVGSGE